MLSPARLGLGLTPITGRDLVKAGDGVLSRATRERWLRAVEGSEQRGVAEAVVGPLVIRRGGLALTVATVLSARTRLPADAVELILFGNAGRNGAAGDFRLAGSKLDGTAFTTAGLAWGFRASPRLDVGARIHATVGHGVVLTRDAGSVLVSGGASASIRLPTISSTGIAPGGGIGLDLGVTWSHAGAETGLTVYNAATTFAWSSRRLRFREGETLIEGAGVDSDFDARPVREAPPTLRALVRRLRPARRIEMQHVRVVSARVHLRLSVTERLERGLALGSPDSRLVGVEWKSSRSLALAAHTGAVEGDWRMGSALRVARGAWALSAAWLLNRGDDRRGSTVALSVTWSSR